MRRALVFTHLIVLFSVAVACSPTDVSPESSSSNTDRKLLQQGEEPSRKQERPEAAHPDSSLRAGYAISGHPLGIRVSLPAGWQGIEGVTSSYGPSTRDGLLQFGFLGAARRPGEETKDFLERVYRARLEVRETQDDVSEVEVEKIWQASSDKLASLDLTYTIVFKDQSRFWQRTKVVGIGGGYMYLVNAIFPMTDDSAEELKSFREEIDGIFLTAELVDR